MQILLLLAQLHPERRKQCQRGDESIRDIPRSSLCPSSPSFRALPALLKAWAFQPLSPVLFRLKEAKRRGRLCSHPGSDTQGNHLHAKAWLANTAKAVYKTKIIFMKPHSLFQVPSSCRRWHYGSPCSYPSQQGLGPPFPVVLQFFSQGKLTNLKDFKDALDLGLVLVFWLISHELHQCCKAKPGL